MNIRRLLLSILIISSVLTVAVSAANSYFSDTETSAGNTLQAGAIDLKIDNESYYNGVVNEDTSWLSTDLADQLFFDFTDAKPDDYGEDTISISAENDFWLCMDMEVTADDDNTCTEPELEDDPNCVEDNDDDFDGELGGLINFIWWADDGDNVFEDGEDILIDITSASDALDRSIALADSTVNNFEEEGALSAEETYYIGKAWCFGELGTDPPGQDDVGDARTPADDNDNNGTAGEPADGGFTCDGTLINNASQTDVLTGDISFYATQARHNDDFVCGDQNLLWIIGDEEEDQEDNPVDELNWPEEFGVFPTPPAIGDDYFRTITSPVDDTADEEFPWNTNYGSDYARNIEIDFDYTGSPITAILTIGWSPGRSANEQKEVFLNATSLGLTPIRTGAPAAGWWEEMERFEDTFSFPLSPGSNIIRIEHQFGDGTLWDFIKLEKQ